MIANSTRTPSISAIVMVSLSRWLRIIVLLLELTETCQDCKQTFGKTKLCLEQNLLQKEDDDKIIFKKILK
jgi:hypothetical protein